MSAPTPGPWEIAPHPDDAEMVEIVADYSELPGGRKVAHWIAELDAGGVDDDRDAMRANARLIAAAPDLLAALRSLLPFLFSSERTMTCAESDLFAAAHSAIAKAEGR